MLDEKFFLKSLTVVAGLLALLVQVLPVFGVSFSADDAAVITEAWDKSVTAILLVLTIYGRWRATTSLTTTIDTSKLGSPVWVGLVAIMLFIAGCATSTVSSLGTPEQRLYQVEANFAVAQEEAALYASRPFCTSVIVIGCADPATVVALDDASDKIEGYIDQARVYVSALGSGVTAPENASSLELAANSLRLLLTLIATAQAQKA